MATSRRTPCSATARSRKARTSGKLWPVSMCSRGNGTGPGQKAFAARVQHHHGVLATGEQQHRPLELRDNLTKDVDRLGLEGVQMVQGQARPVPGGGLYS